jgi:hypothetical protein
MMKYSIHERGQNDKARLEKLFQFQGPDSATIKVLDRHNEEWLTNPACFWTLPSPLNLNLLDPQAQIVGCYLRAKDEDA